MLQIAALLSLLWITTALPDSLPGEVEWMLDDALYEQPLALSLPSVSAPHDLARALRYYHDGEYRPAAEILEKIRQLHLPDGDLDLVCLALAECNRQLGLHALAVRDYRVVADRFPHGDKAAPSLFRLLQHAYERRDTAEALRHFEALLGAYPSHPLVHSARYVMGKLHFRRGDYARALEMLSPIPPRSSRRLQARFLMALCRVKREEWDDALVILDRVRRRVSPPVPLGSETAITLGDIYLKQGTAETALRYYDLVPASAARHEYASVRKARCLLELDRLDEARRIASKTIRNAPDSPYYFDMLSILETVHHRLGNRDYARRLNHAVAQQVASARLTFKVYDELDRIEDQVTAWSNLEYAADARGDNTLVSTARRCIARLHKLRNECWDLMHQTGLVTPEERETEASNLAFTRYLGKLRNRMRTLEAHIEKIQDTCDTCGQSESPQGSEQRARIDSLKQALASLEREYDLVARECREPGRRTRGTVAAQAPVKYIDWAFVNYQRKKKLLRETARLRSGRDSTAVNLDSLSPGARATAVLFPTLDKGLIKEDIAHQRAVLREHIGMMLRFYPQSTYAPQILFRLAELHYDRESDRFDKQLRRYEEALARNKDSTGVPFPEHDIGDVLAVYDRIIDEHSESDLADDALFYKALGLRKIERFDEANDALATLCARYPRSEYFVEAKMNIGRYYFERPRIHGGKGYDLAQDAFREVLFYRDHPQFVQALYNLGWCYYMKDRYDEAIAVFRYLVEEGELEFDAGEMDRKQIVNPLLRDEAIDYLAISFDEEGKVDEAVRFLDLVGNVDYAALVLKRIGELREEVRDFDEAIETYRRLLREYPNSSAAPDAEASLINVRRETGGGDDADRRRASFIERYGPGSPWRAARDSTDSGLVARVDSMAISIGLYMADRAFRRGRNGDSTSFNRAAEGYQAVVDAYPSHEKALDARWNLAVIFDRTLNRPRKACDHYIAFSRADSPPQSRRKQAALNAVAAARRFQIPDSLVVRDSLDPPAVTLIRTCDNYLTLFPKGEDASRILLNKGAVYFNRGLFSRALQAYAPVIEKGSHDSLFYRALLLTGHCRFGRDKWPEAAEAFERVARNASNTELQQEAYTFLLKSHYLMARKLLDDGATEQAAEAFIDIEERFPQSEYGDVVLFNAAEAFEKLNRLPKACWTYLRLADAYPNSALAPEALFNAATAFESHGNYNRAAQAYERLVADYPEAEKSKDALFNVGLCYEKLGKLDKMARAHERYSERYPGEADVKALLLRSAKYYDKAGMKEKAAEVYRNFVERYELTPEAVEAVFRIGMLQASRGDTAGALDKFREAMKYNAELAEQGLEDNNFAAGEAAFAVGEIARVRCASIRFDTSGAALQQTRSRKSELLNDAVTAYAQAMRYGSVRMFEAGYRMGEVYEEFAESWVQQRQSVKDPIKAAVVRRDILQSASTLLRRAFEPYRKLLQVASRFDSLGAERSWVSRARESLAQDYVLAGDYLVKSVSVMYRAPIPGELKTQPLHLFQYLKQLNETLREQKITARDYFLRAYRTLDSLDIDSQATAACGNKFGMLCFRIGHDNEKLAERILRKDYSMPEGLSDAEREDLEFNLEDLVFELQDKAIFAYEDGLDLLKSVGPNRGHWYGKIMEGLARLSPETYGSSYYHTVSIGTDTSWVIRSDSVPGWCGESPPRAGWQRALRDSLPPLSPGGFPADPIVSPDTTSTVARARKDFFLDGEPRDASVYVVCPGPYRLFLNGMPTLSDSARQPSESRVDSLTNIGELIHGGDNVLAAEFVTGPSPASPLTVALTVMLDTSMDFQSTLTPLVKTVRESAGPENIPDDEAEPDSTAGAPAASDPVDTASVRADKDRAEVLEAISDYQRRIQETEGRIRRQRLEVQKMRIEKEEIDKRINEVKEEIRDMHSGEPATNPGPGPESESRGGREE